MTDDGPARPARSLTVEFVPSVGMRHLTGLPFVCTLGVADALGEAGLGAGIGWPWHVVADDGEALLAEVGMHAGNRDGQVSMSCEVTLLGAAAGVAGEQVRRAVLSRVQSWETAVEGGYAITGPVAPVMEEYFDRTPLMGKPVEALIAGGAIGIDGVLCGIDTWGRATIRLEDGREIDLAPEQGTIQAPSEDDE